jgi:hypothetical protein
MTASTIKDQVFSGFGFSLLSDSGWYGIDESDFEDFQAGKGMGCNWFQGCHNKANSDWYCEKNGAPGCTFDYTAVGTCSNFFMQADHCATVMGYDNFDCNVDDGSSDTE